MCIPEALEDGFVIRMPSTSPFCPARHNSAISHHGGAVLTQSGQVRVAVPGAIFLWWSRQGSFHFLVVAIPHSIRASAYEKDLVSKDDSL